MSIDNPRQRFKTSGYYLVYDTTTDELIGRVVNLSLEGTMLISDHPIDVPTRLSCRMPLLESIDGQNTINFTLESRWSKKNDKFDWHESGFKFVEISDLDRKLIGKLMESWLAEENNRSGRVTTPS